MPSYAKMLRKTPDGAISSAARMRGADPRLTAQGASSRPAWEASPITPKMARLIRSVRSGSDMRPNPYAALAKAAASDSPVIHVSRKKRTNTPERSAKPGHLHAAARLEGFDGGHLLEGQRQLVPAGEEPVLAEPVDLEADRGADGGAVRRGDGLRLQVHRQPRAGPCGERLPQCGRGLRRYHDRQRTVLEAVLEEDVAEARADHDPDAVIEQRPHRHLPRGAAAEVLGGHQDARVTVAGPVQHEVRPLRAAFVETHVVEEHRAEAALARPPQEARRDDAVGVDVGQVHRGRHRGEPDEGLHRRPQASVRTSVSRPVTAAAAAIAGLMRCVRAPGPWRPSKLRLDVLATRSSAAAVSPLIPTHIEQPGSRHSKPASRNTRSSPSASAARLTPPEPGTTHAGTAARRPRAIAAAARRSSRRLLVQEPMNTRFTGVPASGAPAVNPM